METKRTPLLEALLENVATLVRATRSSGAAVVSNNISDTTSVDAMPDRSAELQTRSSTDPSRDGCGKHRSDPHEFGSTISLYGN
jgi:hypothetical protein